ncbi:MAG: DUF2085 domain-containing protein [Candidatus ainarchaeum sp.]|nr:DUF2085 domain-containing protein [Candidatus ainarchaeum sp.]
MRKYLGYALYMGIAAIFILPIFITPFLPGLGALGLFDALQRIYAPSCHQLASRSICYFTDGTIDDCARNGTAVIGRQSEVRFDSLTGYKFPVCSRDVAIYGAMLLGGLLFPFVRKIDDRIAPPLIYFIIALVPIALDGGTQLVGLRESTNMLRLITGFIAGFPIPFYAIPIINMFVLGPGSGKEEAKKVKKTEKKAI